jgi:hypothetical protein
MDYLGAAHFNFSPAAGKADPLGKYVIDTFIHSKFSLTCNTNVRFFAAPIMNQMAKDEENIRAMMRDFQPQIAASSAKIVYSIVHNGLRRLEKY